MSHDKKLKEELSRFALVEEVHDLPPIFHYWAEKFFYPKFGALGFDDPADLYLKFLTRTVEQNPGRVSRFFSVGAGNCDTEVSLTESLLAAGVRDFKFICIDINPAMLERGRQMVMDRQLSDRIDFVQTDIKDWRPSEKFQAVLAHHSLHHIVDLESLFDTVYDSLDDRGVFLTNDMIGRNGHMRWPEALEILLALWSLLDDKHKLNHATGEVEPVYENFDSSNEGFEGIRAQDILPLLVKKFNFDTFLGYNNLISVFIDRNFGPNFDPDDARDRQFIDLVTGLDDYFIEVGKLKPTQMSAAMVKGRVRETQVFKHLTPAFCVRPPDLDQDLIYITDPNPYAFKMPLMTKIKRRGFHKLIPKAIRARLKRII